MQKCPYFNMFIKIFTVKIQVFGIKINKIFIPMGL